MSSTWCKNELKSISMHVSVQKIFGVRNGGPLMLHQRTPFEVARSRSYIAEFLNLCIRIIFTLLYAVQHKKYYDFLAPESRVNKHHWLFERKGLLSKCAQSEKFATVTLFFLYSSLKQPIGSACACYIELEYFHCAK